MYNWFLKIKYLFENNIFSIPHFLSGISQFSKLPSRFLTPFVKYFRLIRKKNNYLYIKFNFIKFFYWFSIKRKFNFFTHIIKQLTYYRSFLILLIKQIKGDGFIYIRGLLLIFFIDASLTDDEPLWEPIEWSLIQSWILFFFIFSWIAENLITSRFGSYTGRDKRVWFAWYKTFWLIELWYALSFGAASLFVIVPFYYELTYNIAFVFSWWNWYNRIFFFKFISIYSIILVLGHLFLINLRWWNWKKSFIIVIIINIFLSYLIFIHFILTFFGYFTDPLWYQKTRFVDYIQLSHEPLKWGWGPAKRDHFTYHKVSTVFWFKNDGPFASSFLIIHMFLFLSLFFLSIFWITLLRRIYATKEVSYTFATYCISSLRQFFYFFLLLYICIFISYIASYWRFPIEFLWIINSHSWIWHFSVIITDYLNFFINSFTL